MPIKILHGVESMSNTLSGSICINNKVRNTYSYLVKTNNTVKYVHNINDTGKNTQQRVGR